MSVRVLVSVKSLFTELGEVRQRQYRKMCAKYQHIELYTITFKACTTIDSIGNQIYKYILSAISRQLQYGVKHSWQREYKIVFLGYKSQASVGVY